MKRVLLSLLMIVIISCQSKNVEKNTDVQKKVEQLKVFPKLEKDRYNVAFLIMDGTFNTELTAPFDIFPPGVSIAICEYASINLSIDFSTLTP